MYEMVRLEPVEANKGIYGKRPLEEVRVVTTIRDMFDSSCELFADKVAFLRRASQKSGWTEITYKEAGRDVYALGTALIKLGLKDKKIAIIGENRYEWEISYLAVVGGVGTVVPIDKELTDVEIRTLLDAANADALIYSPKLRKKYPELFETLGVKLICMEEHDTDESFDELIKAGNLLIEQGDRSFIDEEVKPEDVDILLFTSGTSGDAKAVMLSHKNVASNLMNMCSMMDIRPEDRFFSMLPLHHTYECTCGFLCPLYRGSSICYCMGLKYIVKNLQEYKPTMVLTVPLVIETIYKQILRTIEKNGMTKKVELGKKITGLLLKFGIDKRKQIFKQIHDNLGGNIRMFIAGAAAVDPVVAKNFRAFGLHAIQGYGLTECAPIVAVNREELYDDAACGLPTPQLEVRIDNPDKDGLGEIVVKGENVMVGYYQKPELTAEVIKDGWFYTGDIGYMKNGFIYITGRKKFVIIAANGENVFPEEIEQLLNRADILSECMVYEKKDENGKVSIAAHILPDKDAAAEILGADYTKDMLSEKIQEEIKKVNAMMPPFKAVTDFDIRETDFIKTTTKKIKRHEN